MAYKTPILSRCRNRHRTRRGHDSLDVDRYRRHRAGARRRDHHDGRRHHDRDPRSARDVHELLRPFGRPGRRLLLGAQRATGVGGVRDDQGRPAHGGHRGRRDSRARRRLHLLRRRPAGARRRERDDRVRRQQPDQRPPGRGRADAVRGRSPGNPGRAGPVHLHGLAGAERGCGDVSRRRDQRSIRRLSKRARGHQRRRRREHADSGRRGHLHGVRRDGVPPGRAGVPGARRAEPARDLHPGRRGGARGRRPEHEGAGGRRVSRLRHDPDHQRGARGVPGAHVRGRVPVGHLQLFRRRGRQDRGLRDGDPRRGWYVHGVRGSRLQQRRAPGVRRAGSWTEGDLRLDRHGGW